MNRVLVLTIVCWSASALAEETPPAEAPSWSVGAGIGSGGVILLGSSAAAVPLGSGQSLISTGGLGSVMGLRSTTGVFSLERALSRRTWLLLDFSGSYATTSQDGLTKDLWTKSASAMLGLRHVASQGGIVDVSAFAAVGVSWLSSNTVLTIGADGTLTNWTATTTGALASAGLIVDRQLVDALSVRLAVTMLQLAYDRSKVDAPSQPNSEAHSLRAAVAMAPALQLRLAF